MYIMGFICVVKKPENWYDIAFQEVCYTGPRDFNEML